MNHSGTELARVVRRAMRTVDVEAHGAPLPVVEGAVPTDLRGVLWRNGAGRLERGGFHYGHPFDGDGLITRFEFNGHRVRYSNRFVRTREFEAEEAAGRILYRGFGTNRPGGVPANALRLRFKNAANTNVVAHGGRLLALWEGGWPHRIDPDTLETLERFGFDGRLVNRRSRLDRWLNPELPFAAHPKVDELTGELYNFGLAHGPQSRLMLYRVSPSGALDEPEAVVLDDLSFAHDFVLTKRWRVFFLPPVAFDIGRAALGMSTPVGSIRMRPDRPMTALLVPRGGGQPVRFEVEPGFVFHFAHGYDTDDGLVVVDGMRMPGFPDLRDLDAVFEGEAGRLALATPVRYILDPATGQCRSQVLSASFAELPTVGPGLFGQQHETFWATAAPEGSTSPYLSAIGRFDVAHVETRLRHFFPDLPGEPVVVPREGGGSWLLSLIYVASEHVTDLLILDGDSLETAARLRLPHHLPPGFHGSFVAADELETRAGSTAGLPKAADPFQEHFWQAGLNA